MCVIEGGRAAARLIYLPLLGNRLTIKWGEAWLLYLSEDRCNHPGFHDASSPSSQWFPRIVSSSGGEARGPLVNLREDRDSLQE